MLNPSETLLLLQCSRALQACKCADHGALALALTDALSATAQARAAMAAAPRRAKPGRPGVVYTVELDPGWAGWADGAQQAVDMVNETLREYGSPEVQKQALQVAVSRNGFWFRLLEGDNGAAGLTVRPRKEQKTGTIVASVQNEHEAETNPETREPRRKRQSPK